MKRIVEFVRDPQFEKEYGFDPSIDYVALWDEFIRVNKAHDREAVRRFLTEQDGIIPFGLKAMYQRQMRSGIVTIDDGAGWKVLKP